MKENNLVPHIWLVEDNPADAVIIEEMLEGFCLLDAFVRVRDIIPLLEDEAPACLLLDLSLPDSVGLEGLVAVQKAKPYLPVVILTGRSDMELALQAINAGAEDYLIKNHLSPDVLRKTISFATERSHLKRELIIANDELAQSKRRVEDLTYALTHDIRSPLSSLRISLNLLKTYDIENTEVKNLLDIIHKSSGQMHATIEGFNEVLQVNNHSKEVREWIEITEVWRDLKKYYTDHLYHIEVDFEEKIGVPRVYFVPFVLRSVLQNLLSNSIKYRRQEVPLQISVDISNDTNGTILVFTDNGRGMDLQKVGNRLFEPFSRFHTDLEIEGTGVGLYIIKAMMEASGGRITVHSEVDKGTTFSLYFNENAERPLELKGQA